ncbi:response regulator transcription factor [Chromobacterium subtsugae]|uniref:Response regulator transcription factor n=2 Tax=Chromobacterium subtsugae TaxID=251747 RepID=A0ABS7FAM1_9NEIS|nr:MULTISPECIES: response regulator transcription factor [Chromobacterium]KZE87222.1 two-component system response regulator [Chromobacterium sp. F49]MBW7565824.1 response regulator transcription factor [Chromobacterium subtsugae]MBW8287136.1 response regulator transcription factor [Chromobacterium subtsugae]OBU88114.1 chemotaxis protein CheY [Chromobacterium subtsugae]WSE93212.1 response regulator transcription factor [Chromobacterium subtsugae]
MNVLLVDDDIELLELLRDYLAREGFAVSCAHDGPAGVAAALSGRHDIAVLDVMMPGMDGIAALSRIRAASAMPVIMLTARGDDADRIAGLELGADDYVPKPCTPRELAARIRAILKRVAGAAQLPAAPAIVAGALTVWPALRRVERGGQAVELTSTEYNLVEALARHAGMPVSKAELSQQALGRPLARFDRSIDVHISSIRHKLGPLADGSPRIQTVIRKGYQLIAG